MTYQLKLILWEVLIIIYLLYDISMKRWIEKHEIKKNDATPKQKKILKAIRISTGVILLVMSAGIAYLTHVNKTLRKKKKELSHKIETIRKETKDLIYMKSFDPEKYTITNETLENPILDINKLASIIQHIDFTTENIHLQWWYVPVEIKEERKKETKDFVEKNLPLRQWVHWPDISENQLFVNIIFDLRKRWDYKESNLSKVDANDFFKNFTADCDVSVYAINTIVEACKQRGYFKNVVILKIPWYLDSINSSRTVKEDNVIWEINHTRTAIIIWDNIIPFDLVNSNSPENSFE